MTKHIVADAHPTSFSAVVPDAENQPIPDITLADVADYIPDMLQEFALIADKLGLPQTKRAIDTALYCLQSEVETVSKASDSCY